jgi:hypothetical protein
MFPVIEVPKNAADSTEQLGTKPKFWFNRNQDLFKQGRENTGENWAEKVACELSGLLGLPHAHYNLAIWGNYHGVVAKNFLRQNERLILGNEILGRISSQYPVTTFYDHTEHTIGRVFAALRSKEIEPPIEFVKEEGIATATDVFTGYLMFDAWIGNTDRHHENWGLIIQFKDISLAPTYDHASSLGRELTDERRLQILEGNDNRATIENYCNRARSAIFKNETDARPLSTIQAFEEAFKLRRPAALAWMERLEKVKDHQIKEIFINIPDTFISRNAKDFAMRVLTRNRSKILQRAECKK